MEKIAVYVRVSDHNEAAHSVLVQSMKIEEYCKAHDYNVCDSALTVGNREQSFPFLKSLLQSAAEKGFSKVVMATANRVVGTVEELEAVTAAINESGVTIETLDGTYEELPASKKIVASFLAQAELDAEDEDAISEIKEK